MDDTDHLAEARMFIGSAERDLLIGDDLDGYDEVDEKASVANSLLAIAHALVAIAERMK